MPRKNSKKRVGTTVKWFKFHISARHNLKLYDLPRQLHWPWLQMLTIAAENGGEIDLKRIRQWAFECRCTTDQFEADLNALIDHGMFDIQGNIASPHNWEKHQASSDPSARDRMRRHRAKKSDVTDDGSRNVTRNVTVTDPERSLISSTSVHTKYSTEGGGASENDLAKRLRGDRLDDDQGGEA